MRRWILGFLLGSTPLLGAQSDNTLHVKQFPGDTVGAKVANAMDSCGVSLSTPCILIIDPSLATLASGTLPALCLHCFLQDWRHGPPLSFTNYGIQVVGQDGNSSINAAITAAGANGSWWVPASYSGADSVANPNNLQGLDFRSNGQDVDIHVWSGISPMRPVEGYPLGNDLRLDAYGPADLHFDLHPLSTTTSTSIPASTETDITVGSTANFSTLARYVRIGRETRSEEICTLNAVLNSKEMRVTCPSSIIGTNSVEQIGSTIFGSGFVQIPCNWNPPTLSERSAPQRWYDSQLNVILYAPCKMTDAFPYAGLQVNAVIFGSPVTATHDLYFQDSISSSTTHFRSSTGRDVFDANDSGAGMIRLNQLARRDFAGTCIMHTGTSCTFSIGSAYNGPPICIATIQSSTVIAGSCVVSGTTVTIYAGFRNSSKWGAVLIGDPN